MSSPLSSLLSNLSSDTEGFPTPRKSLWSANFKNTQSNHVSNLEDDSLSLDTDLDRTTHHTTMPLSDDLIVWSSPFIGSKEDIHLKKKSKQLREQEWQHQEARAVAEAQKKSDLMEVLQLLKKRTRSFTLGIF